ncbi:bifunctional phosphoribosylaminoimidazolecarboxamide formyltransferase/IMP cyclohydrolase, partial [Candidatus Woesearchaeota archaeon]|nr:bifunctional phosphoribosylaminoimidazolecarboxamide formyltransferase/IMP cyclohydrolase [Candidatus Woesearchaeota archaeon]
EWRQVLCETNTTPDVISKLQSALIAKGYNPGPVDPVTLISDYTGQEEILDGRVKTTHPRVLGGILAVRGNKKHMDEVQKQNIKLIDMVVVNLYPFEKTISDENSKLKDAIENIDIGGPTLIRAAAKNSEDVAVVVNKNDYNLIIEELKKHKKIKDETKQKLMVKAFEHTARYDSIINSFFQNKFNPDEFPSCLNLTFEKIQDLRYGENPYQKSAFYKEPFIKEACVSEIKQLHGKELSYNNILDVNDAFELVKDFEKPTAAVIKHTNPCGVGSASTIEEAYKKAHETDPLSAFGSIVALNRNCNLEIAKIINELFIEVVVCPGFEKNALNLLNQKKNIRLLETGSVDKTEQGYDMKKMAGGMLVQTRNFPELDKKDMKIVSNRIPSEEEINSMLFSFKVNKHVKSNSIVFVKDNVTVGIGAGQMSRVDAVKIAVIKSNGKSKGAVMSSDAYFPFRDGIDEAAKAGITAVIQPGGSIRDKEIIDAVNEHGMTMVFTGIRLFKH